MIARITEQYSLNIWSLFLDQDTYVYVLLMVNI
jgi:hypothetical protein